MLLIFSFLSLHSSNYDLPVGTLPVITHRNIIHMVKESVPIVAEFYTIDHCV